jgi:RNA polymerase sigma-70 factor (ECF subfamily)
VELARQDPHNFRYIVERYQGRLFAYLRRMAYYSQEDREDMVQEIFIKVYRSLNDFDSAKKFSSLIYRIAHNHLVDCIRRSSCRFDQNSLDSEDALRFVRAEINLEVELAGKDVLEKIKKAISGLPANYREALILKFLEEKTLEEVSEILRKPRGTVATLVRRGREKLKANLMEAGLEL